MPKTTSAAAKRAGRKRTDGAAAAAAAAVADRKESGSKAVAEVKRSTRGARKRRPILERKLDLLYFIFFMVHVPVMLGELLNLIVFSFLKSCLGYLPCCFKPFSYYLCLYAGCACNYSKMPLFIQFLFNALFQKKIHLFIYVYLF